MKSNYWKLALGLLFVVIALAVGIAASTPARPEGTVLTPQQVKKLFTKAERVEKQPAVKQAVKNRKGEVVGYTTTQTVVVYMRGRPGGGGLRMSTSCTKSCSGTPTTLDPGNPNNTCSGQSPTGCDPQNGNCSTCTCPNGCNCSCSGTTTAFGNLGLFLAMADAEDPSPDLVAKK